MAPRAKRGTTGAVQSHADLTCWVCGGEADVDDSPWLCLCTTEERRVHKACATQRLHAGTEPTPCVHCGMSNQYKPISSARSRARVVVIGAGPAGLGAAKWLRERGLEPVVLEARQRVGGRIETVEMGGHPIDLGAAYIHGCDAAYNPVYRLAMALNEKIDQTAGGYSAGWGVRRRHPSARVAPCGAVPPRHAAPRRRIPTPATPATRTPAARRRTPAPPHPSSSPAAPPPRPARWTRRGTTARAGGGSPTPSSSARTIAWRPPRR